MKKFEYMIQPEELKTNARVAFAGGKGNEVWEMLMASTLGNLSKVQQLLKSEPSLANCEWGYFTPLHFAVREGHTDIVKLLLDYGADATVKNLCWQDSPTTKARDRGQETISDLLQNHLTSKFQSSPAGAEICNLIKERKISQVMELLRKTPALLHSSDDRGNTPLHWAVMTRQLELIDQLFDLGADAQAKRADGSTPVQVAIQGDYWYRSSRDLESSAIRNPWFVAGYLISKGADYDLHIASSVGDTEAVVRFLQETPTMVNEKDSSGRTALYYAAKFGHLQTLKTLLEHGADPNNLPQQQAWTKPAAWAERKGHTEIIDMLKLK